MQLRENWAFFLPANIENAYDYYTGAAEPAAYILCIKGKELKITWERPTFAKIDSITCACGGNRLNRLLLTIYI
jgi:hypothetical protein